MSLPENAASADAVLKQLREHAERKAAFSMFYSAADLFREYKGPYASETAAERAKLADEYEQRGRVAEQQRRDGIPITPAPRPPVQPRPITTTPSAPRPPRPTPVATTTSATPKPASGAPGPKKIDFTAPHTIENGRFVFACRWCKETISFEVEKATQILPCPKCDSLISVPKLPS